MKTIQQNADYIHCAAHNLNLALYVAVGDCKEVAQYFNILQNIYTFFDYK